MKNFLGVDWEEQLPEQIFDYINDCKGEQVLTDFQKNEVRKMVKNAFKQDKRITH